MIRLLWAVHSHQPVGNFDFIFERAFDQSYRPFLQVLAEHPRIRLSMHFSGILLDWLEAKRPDYIAGLRALVERGQVEILGGGFYEPILPVISDAHKIAQLRKLQGAVTRLFGVTPRGLWLAERVWEPTLVKPIVEAGLEYVLLDGSHFKMVGKRDEDMDGYFLSEDQGRTLKLFPIHDVIRDYIPFRPVEEVIDTLLRLESPGGPGGGVPESRDVQVVFGDDGEKFGDWPGTHGHVYGDHRWLHRFFEAIEARPDRLRVEPVADGLRAEKNLGLVYLPPASYQEMMIWAQDARDIVAFRRAQQVVNGVDGGAGAKFLRGTFWRNFFNKYPESNRMHKQGVRLARDLESLGNTPATSDREAALDHILQSQCNCAYWHGVFGGLYLPHLRFALYRHLIEAQRALDRIVFARGEAPAWETHDWNCDGKPEHTLNTPELYLSLTREGELDQLWLKKTGINLADALTRRYEAYHESVGGASQGGPKLESQLGEKEANLRSYLVYDRRPRNSLSEVYLPVGSTLHDYLSQTWRPAFKVEWKAPALERSESGFTATFEGRAERNGAPAFAVEKRVHAPRGSGLRVEWTFRSLVGETLRFGFGCEALFCLLAGNAPDRYIEWTAEGRTSRDILASRGELPHQNRLAVADEWLRLRCEVGFEGAARVWRDALETVSQSEGGYERVYQGTVVVPIWDVELKAGDGSDGPSEVRAALSIEFKEGV